MAEYQSNSHRSREQAAEVAKKEKMEKVVSGKVKTKKNEGRRLMNMFISEDAGNVKEYVLMDIIVPAISNTILDIIKNSAEMIFGGHSSSRGRSNSPKVSYRRYYDERNNDRRYDRGRDRDRDRDGSGRFNYDDLVYDSRGDAEVVRTLMLEALDEYGMVTVADMYDMSGMTAPWTASNYGWMGLRDIKVIRVRDGYILNLPKAMPID